MKNLVLFGILIMFLSSCEFEKKGIEIKGIIDGGANQYIYLVDITPVNAKPDSVLISDKGKFKFYIETTEPKDFILYTSEKNFVRILAEPFDELIIMASYGDLAGSYDVKNSPINEDIIRINQHITGSYRTLDSLNMVYNQHKDSAGFDTIVLKLNKRSMEIYDAEKKFLADYIENNPGSLASYVALAQKFNRDINVFNPDKDLQYFKMVDTAFQRKYPNAAMSNQIHSFVVKKEAEIKKRETEQKVSGIGAIAPDISLPNPQGEIIALSDFRGKYVLLDFWAAWCKPCRVENPNLVQLYRKYRWKGFEIYQVSLDKDTTAWIDAIKNDRLNWTQVSDLKYWKSAPAKLYNVEAIPANFLLDKEGKIIAKNLRGEALQNKLKEIFDNPQAQ